MARKVDINIPQPHPAQMEILRSQKRFNHVQCGRRFGKSEAIKYLALPSLKSYDRKLPAEPNYNLGLFFPTYKDLEPIWVQFKDLFYHVIKKKDETLKEMTLINGSKIEFWSLENPDSGRGRKYHRVILDEFAKVKRGEDAWEYTVRPTLSDYKGDGYFLSTPKGRKNYFYKLKEKHVDSKDWKFFHYKTVDNPFIDPEEVEEARQQIDPIAFAQEYEALDVDKNENPFLWAFEDEKHIGEFAIDPKLPIMLSFDFNVDPMSCIVAQNHGAVGLRVVDEIRLPNSGIEAMCDRIRVKYGKWIVSHAVTATGDASGLNRIGLGHSTTNYWRVIKQHLTLRDQQIRIPRRNMGLADSRVLCNSALNAVDIQINKKCTQLISDCRFAIANEEGKLVKDRDMNKNDMLDTFRYMLHLNYPDIVTEIGKYKKFEDINSRARAKLKVSA